MVMMQVLGYELDKFVVYVFEMHKRDKVGRSLVLNSHRGTIPDCTVQGDAF